jgi:hypothetical protein
MRAATTPNPANKRVWIAADPSLEGKTLSRLGSGFFSFGRTRPTESQATDWTALRDRWEYSHVARAAFATLSFILLVVSIPYGSAAGR